MKAFALFWLLVVGFILPAAAQETITSPSAASGVVGTPFSFQITGTGPVVTYSYTPQAQCPPGLLCRSVTGIASGTPTTAGVYSLTQSTYGSAGLLAQKSLVITITDEPEPEPDPWVEADFLQAIVGVLFFFALVHGFVVGRGST